MKKTITLTLTGALLVLLASFAVVFAMDHSKMDHSQHDHSNLAQNSDMDMKSDSGSSMSMPGHFEKTVVQGDIEAKFQIMSFASMNMKPMKGETHHIMVKFINKKTGKKIDNAVGKVQVVFPDGKKKGENLKNYSGDYTANYSFENGKKYGVMCIVKADGKKESFKFWYNHME
jgi:hypothetical protein